MKRFSAFAALCAVFLAGCTVGPDYVPPVVETPVAFASAVAPAVTDLERAETERTESTAPQPEAAWWTAFGDELLTDLVHDAVRHNHDLEQARANLREARALRRITAAQKRPQVGAGATAQSSSGSENALGANAALAQQGLTDLEGELYEPED